MEESIQMEESMISETIANTNDIITKETIVDVEEEVFEIIETTPFVAVSKKSWFLF